MTEEKVRSNIARNISAYRRQMGWTQTELSERINYSDKSVSKWERGEGVPDIYVLISMSELFGVSLSDMTAEKPRRSRPGSRKQRILVTLLASGLVWLVATVVFFLLAVASPELKRIWLCFIAAIPVTGIVLLVFAVKWWHLWLQFLSTSLIIWGVAVCFDLALKILNNITLIYIIAAVLEVLTVLWYALVYIRRSHKRSNESLPSE